MKSPLLQFALWLGLILAVVDEASAQRASLDQLRQSTEARLGEVRKAHGQVEQLTSQIQALEVGVRDADAKVISAKLLQDENVAALRADERRKLVEIDGRVDALRKEIEELRNEREQALEELRLGHYCSKCGRPASQIQREENESFQQHLGRVSGQSIPASAGQLQKTASKYDLMIARVQSKVEKETALISKTQEETKRSIQAEQRAFSAVESAASTARGRLETARSDLREAKSLLSGAAHAYKMTQGKEALRRNHRQLYERSIEREVAWKRDDKLADARELDAEARVLRGRLARIAKVDLTTLTPDQLKKAQGDMARFRALEAQAADIRESARRLDQDIEAREESRAQDVQRYNERVRVEAEEVSRLTGSALQPVYAREDWVPRYVDPSQGAKAAGDQADTDQAQQEARLLKAPAIKEIGSSSYDWKRVDLSKLRDSVRLPDFASRTADQVREVLDVDVDKLKDKIRTKLISGLVKGKFVEPLSTSVRTWGEAVYDNAKKRVKERGLSLANRALDMVGIERPAARPLSPEEAIDLQVIELFSTSIQAPHDYSRRQAWTDRAVRVLDSAMEGLGFGGDQ